MAEEGSVIQECETSQKSHNERNAQHFIKLWAAPDGMSDSTSFLLQIYAVPVARLIVIVVAL